MVLVGCGACHPRTGLQFLYYPANPLNLECNVNNYAEPISIMEHQLQEAIDSSNRTSVIMYAQELKQYLEMIIKELRT